MTCRWCSADVDPADLLAHLADAHGDLVELDTTATGLHTYGVTCPECGSTYTRRIKPHVADEGFIAEFDSQIRMVALDMLVCHLIAEHDGGVPTDDAASDRASLHAEDAGGRS